MKRRYVLQEVVEILEKFRFTPSDLKIYSLLLSKKEMSVSEIARELNLSKRFVRDRLKELCKRGIIRRKLVEKGWIGYIYLAESPKTVLSNIKKQLINEIEQLESSIE
ncbi:MAG: transcriptional regulator [Archaeoglobales archaeon]|nr:transcriptional regulator [Archaeoglobales archaeon]